jgi:hypothetical protein
MRWFCIIKGKTNANFVGKGMALIDPAIVEEMRFTTGDVIEITTSSGKKKTFALLWSGQARRL